MKQAIGIGEVDLALGHFGPDKAEILAPFELKGPALDNLDAIMPGRLKRRCTGLGTRQRRHRRAVGAGFQPEGHPALCGWPRPARLRTVRSQPIDEPGEFKWFVLILGVENLLGGNTSPVRSSPATRLR